MLETKRTHPGDDSGDNGDPFRVMPQERKRVFGENILPHHLACQGFCHPQYSMPNSPEDAELTGKPCRTFNSRNKHVVNSISSDLTLVFTPSYPRLLHLRIQFF